MSDPRYQECSFRIKRLRDRFLLLVPFEALFLWFVDRYTYTERQYVTVPLTVRQTWSIARGMAHARMNYTWTWAEVKARESSKETACQKQETVLDI
jgi:hypothetical protein